MKLRDKVSLRFFLIYLSFFVCIVLILVPIYSVAHSLYAANCVRTSEEMLRSGLNDLEAELTNLQLAVLEMLEDSNLSLLTSQKEAPGSSQYYRIVKAHELFSRSMRYRGVGQDTGLIFANGVILTPERIFHNGTDLYGHYLKVEGLEDYAQWRAQFDDFQGIGAILPARVVRGAGGGYTALTYVFRPTSTASMRTVMFFATLSESYLWRKLLFEEMTDGSTLTLYDLSGEPLYASQDARRTGDILIHCESQYLGVRAVLGINPLQFSKELAPFRRLVIGSAASLLCLGLLLTLLYAYRASVPVRAIVRMAMRIAPQRSESSETPRIKNDYQYIRSFIEQAGSTFTNYENALIHQNELLRSVTLLQLVQGQLYHTRALQRAQEYFPNFPSQYCLALTRPEDEGEEQLEEVSSRLLLM